MFLFFIFQLIFLQEKFSILEIFIVNFSEIFLQPQVHISVVKKAPIHAEKCLPLHPQMIEHFLRRLHSVSAEDEVLPEM